MPGTGGTPASARLFMDLASKVGYRVIGLMYDDTPAVNVVCPPVPDPKCSESFRQKRIYGDNVTNIVDDTPAESIVARLTKLLDVLERALSERRLGRIPSRRKTRLGTDRGERPFAGRRHGGVHREGSRSLPGGAVLEPLGFLQSRPSARNVAFQTAGDSARPLVCGVSRARTGCGIDVSHVSSAGHSNHTAASARLGTAPDAGRCCRRCDGVPLERRRRCVRLRSTRTEAPAYLPVWKFLLGDPTGNN